MNRPNSLVEIQDGGVYNEMVLITGDKKAGLRLYGLPGKLPIIDAEGARPPEGFRRSCIALEADNVVVKGVCLMWTRGAVVTRWGRGATLRNVVIIAGRPFYRFVSPSLSLEGSLLIGVGQNSIWDIPSRIGLDWRFQDNIVLGTSLSADGPALFVNNILMMRKMTFRGAAEGVAGLRLSHNTVLDRINIGEERTFYREWLVRDNIAAGISVGAYAMREGKISHCCFYGPSPQYFKAAKPGEGCITVGPKKRPIFLGEENFDFRLHPKSPCRGKASDGGDIGARITPHMLQMLRLGKAILDNGGKVTPQFFQDFFAKQSPIQKRRTRRKALRE